MAKLDFVRMWALTSAADVTVVPESWLSKSVLDADLLIDGMFTEQTDLSIVGE